MPGRLHSRLHWALLLSWLVTASAGGAVTVPAQQFAGTEEKAAPRSERNRNHVRVLFIGDSLSIDSFGDTLLALLSSSFGDKQVCFFASCGSSPEDWLSSTPVFVTSCGYRRYDLRGAMNVGARPIPTPKLAGILAAYAPDLIAVEQGTNWFDKMLAGKLDERGMRDIVREFVREIRAHAPADCRIVWIKPPDASRYSQATKSAANVVIEGSARELGFATIDSYAILGRYRKGETGSDGVHLGKSAGRLWARGVFNRLFPSRVQN